MGCCQICQASGGLTALVWLNGEVINATVCKTVIRGFESHFNLRRPKYKEGQWKLCAGCPYCGNSSSAERWHSSQRVGFDSLFPLNPYSSDKQKQEH
jgi:hypothetical protein